MSVLQAWLKTVWETEVPFRQDVQCVALSFILCGGFGVTLIRSARVYLLSYMVNILETLVHYM